MSKGTVSNGITKGASELAVSNGNDMGDASVGTVGKGSNKGEASEDAMTRGRQARAPWAMAMMSGR